MICIAKRIIYKIYWNNSDFADRTDLRFSRAVYFLLGNFSIMCAEHAVRQRSSATFARLLEVARYTFSLSVRSSQLQYRIAQSEQGARKRGGGDRCRNWCGMLRSYEAAGRSPLETFVPHKLDILPEDVRYWTLLDVR